ncbi:methyltransferase domain-containing protein [Chloroflexota bacterium]
MVISNCVINLSPDKKRVYDEAFRVLKPDGRVMVSDIALLKELPPALKSNIAAYVGCVAGATTREEYLATVAAAGFKEVEIVNEVNVKGLYDESTVSFGLTEDEITEEQLKEAGDSMISMQVQAFKPSE